MMNFKKLVFDLYDFSYDKEITEVSVENGVYVNYDGKTAKVGGSTIPELMRAYMLFAKNIKEGKNAFCIEETPNFKYIGVMMDISRNAVPHVHKMKEFILRVASMGLNMVTLYMEDTYELEGYPHMGYMRPRYSVEQLREIDDYAFSLGVELVPEIQTLGHMTRYLQWFEAGPIKDTQHVLLADDENTYKFIEAQVSTMRKAFPRAKQILIGCDETHDLGQGRYFDIHGYVDKSIIFNRHLAKVLEICKKYGFSDIGGSADMYFRMASKGRGYYCPDVEFDSETIKNIPDMRLGYWDYYHRNPEMYKKLFAKHKELGRRLRFSGGIWTWSGHLLSPTYTLNTMYPAFTEAIKADMEYVSVSMFGDDGGECNYWQGLPFVSILSEICYRGLSCTREDVIDMIEYQSGTTWDVYESMGEYIDHTNEDMQLSLLKNILYTNMFYQFVYTDKSFSELHDIFANGYNTIKNSVGYRFKDFAEVISKIVLTKIDIMAELRTRYKDKEYSNNLIDNVLPELIEDYKKLSDIHRKQWLETYQTIGYELVNGRYAWAIADIEFQIYRLKQYVNDEIGCIEELEREVHEGLRGGLNWFRGAVSASWHF